MKKMFLSLAIISLFAVSINAETLLDDFKFSEKKLSYKGRNVAQVWLI